MSVMKVLVGLGVLISVSGCATQIEMRHSVPCTSLVPDDIKKPVAGAAIPSVDGNWFSFGDAQTAQLDQANKLKTQSLSIVSACEARDRSAILIKRKGRFFKDFSNKKK